MDDYPEDFGQQVAAHSGLPADLEREVQRITHPIRISREDWEDYYKPEARSFWRRLFERYF